MTTRSIGAAASTTARISAPVLPAMFKMALQDDALAPAYPAGSMIIWSTSKAPRIGSVGLVRDAHGAVHAEVLSAPEGFAGELLAVGESISLPV